MNLNQLNYWIRLLTPIKILHPSTTLDARALLLIMKNLTVVDLLNNQVSVTKKMSCLTPSTFYPVISINYEINMLLATSANKIFEKQIF
jgi:hypothetical protein